MMHLELLIFTLYLAIISWIDYHYLCIPDILVFGLIIWTHYHNCSFSIAIGSIDSILGHIWGYCYPLMCNRGYYWWHQEKGIGYGDIKFMCALGGILGVTGITWCSLIASSTALFGIMITQKKKIAFGPYLCSATIALIIVKKI